MFDSHRWRALTTWERAFKLPLFEEIGHNKRKLKNPTGYCTYVLKDSNWVPYYVGAGRYNRPTKSIRTFGREKEHGQSIVDIYPAKTKEEAHLKEIELIRLYGRQDIRTGVLLNKTDGGLGALRSIKTEKQIHHAKTKLWTERARGIVSKRMKEDNPNKFRKNFEFTQVAKDRLSLTCSRRNIVRLVFYNRVLGISVPKRLVSKETRARRSISMMGNTNGAKKK